jgi:hypothetical protein
MQGVIISVYKIRALLENLKFFQLITKLPTFNGTNNFVTVGVGLVWSHDPKSYAGGSVCYW